MQTISSIDTIYQSPNALPQNADNGTVYATLNNGELPIDLYKYDTNEWVLVDQVRAGVLYYVADQELLYTFKSTSPYFAAASYTDTSQLTNTAAYTTKTYVDGLAQAGVEARQQLANDIAAKYTKPTAGIPSTDMTSAVQTSLGKADSALQSISSTDVTTALGFTPYNASNPSGYTKVEASSTNGNIKIDNVDTTVYTLPNDVATTSDVNAKYTLPSGGIPKTDLASGVQSSLDAANSALQSISSSDVTDALGYTPYNSTNPSGYTKVESSSTNGNIKINGNETTVYTLPNTVATTSDVTAVSNRVTTIEGEIPSQASSSNQLADKNFVNSSINALAAYYITKNAAGDPFATKAELNAATTFYSGGVARVPTTNDYCIVLADESKQSTTGVDPTTRYSYQGSQWEYQYTINDTPLTSAQLAALNSGITSSLVTQIGTNTTAIAGKQDEITSTNKLDYSLIANTPTIPTVNDATLTVQLNGSNVQTFTANQSTNATANIQALPNYSLSIGNTNGGNPRQVLFCSVNYTNFDSNSGAYFKLGAMSGHGNGSAYTFVEDIFINVNYQGTVTCQVYKYVQQTVTLDSVTRNYGDVFYTIDTTNKIVYFYILLGQYSSAQFTPATKIGAAKAVTSANGIIQYSGTPTYYSSGEKVWATGDSATYVRSSDLATVATTGSYNDLSNTPTIPSAVTSINGLSGGTLTSPLVIKGGDAATAAKIALDQTASGQITNNGTQTIFGFTTNNATTLTIGHSSYAMALRGSGTRPKYNGNDLAMASDSAPSIVYTTTAPTEANASGLKVALLDSEPATKYDGWIYLIKE